MNKTVDINERTLEAEKNDFVGFCKVGEKLLTLFYVMVVVGAVALFIMLILSNVMKNEILDEELRLKFTTANGIFDNVCNIIIFIGTSIALRHFIKVFQILKDGKTPFRYEVADKIKASGLIFLNTGVIALIAEFIRLVLTVLNLYNSDETIVFELSPLIWAAGLLAIAYIFNYGCKLQQESDETI